MDFTTALLVLLGLTMTMTVCTHPVCQKDCTLVDKSMYREHLFKHVSIELRHTSVAPWNMSSTYVEDRLPSTIYFAQCTTCTKEDLTAKTIYLEIPVFYEVPNNKRKYCLCPFQLAVGCTCVKKMTT